MKSTKRLISALLVTAALLAGARADSASCNTALHGGAGAAVEVFTRSLQTIYNVFPIRVGGVSMNFFPKLEDIKSVSNAPICTCLTPFPRVGIKVSFWEPIAVIEPTAIPWCSPSLGASIPAGGPGGESYGANGQRAVSHLKTYQAHFIKYPVFALIDYLADFICLDGGSGMDIGYITELDPLWQNDIWAAIIGPEAYLVANPVAQTACMADSVASAAGFPIDPLWWCLGSWGSAFPMTQNVKDAVSPMETQAAISARLLMKLHRQMMLWGSIGEAGLCQSFPMPIMRKSQYGIFPVYPSLGWPFRIPIGRSGLVWDRGIDNTANMHVGAWMVYRKRDCCAF